MFLCGERIRPGRSAPSEYSLRIRRVPWEYSHHIRSGTSKTCRAKGACSWRLRGWLGTERSWRGRNRKTEDMDEKRDVRLVLPDGAEVASTAFVGVCDVSGAGCACVSNVASETYQRRVYDVGVVGMETRSILRSEGLLHPVQLCNFCDEAGCPVVSMLALNTTLENRHFHLLLALALADLLQGCEVVLLVSGTILPPALRKENIPRGGMFKYQGINPYAAAVSKLPPVPSSTPIADELLASIMHVFVAAGRPLGCLFVTGYREPYGGVDEDAVRILGKGMSGIMGPHFHMCAHPSKTLTRWNDEDESRSTPYIA